MFRRISVAILRASLWSGLAGALITLALWLRTSPELRPGFRVATWFGLSWALAIVPSVAMELGVVHLLLHLGSEEPAKGSDEMAVRNASPSNELQRKKPAQGLEPRR